MAASDATKGDKNAQYLEIYAKNLKPEEKSLVETLYKNQGERDVLEEEYNKEKAALDAKYRQLYAPIYKARSQIVAGKEVQQHTVADGEDLASIAAKYSTTVEELKKLNTTDGSPAAGTVLTIASSEKKTAGAPKFWLQCFQNHPDLCEQITEKDAKILELLEDIEEEDVPGQSFTLRFVFKQPNSFFSEPVLEKTIWAVEKARSGEVEVLKDKGSKISWASPSVNPSIKVMKKKAKAGQRDAKPQMKIEQVESFFRIFETKVEDVVQVEGEDLSPERASQMQQLEEDYMIAVTIREEVLPEAAKWYTGQAKMEYEAMYDEDEDEFEGDEDEGEDDGDDDDEDEDDEGKAAKKAGAAGQKGPAGENPECKQQ